MVTLPFWISVAGVFYAYVGYPVLLWCLARLKAPAAGAASHPAVRPSITMIVPVHNEAATITAKLQNTLELKYDGELSVLFVSDGSTDRTVGIIKEAASPRIDVLALPDRSGKAAALNLGLAHATGDLIVFSDAAILLAPDALERIVEPFRDPVIGCVSGEDRIHGGGGEGMYGRYELAVRRLESQVGSIIGASGSFYGQRRSLVTRFEPGLAPDFLSVLRTLEAGYRAVAAPDAVGTMAAIDSPAREFDRKVRTLLRGITTLFKYGSLLNVQRHGIVAVQLLSHKLMRWLVPLFLILVFATSAILAADSGFFLMVFVLQILFYAAGVGAAAQVPLLRTSMFGKLALYFSVSNAAVLVAWVKFARGVRQEIWAPSQR